MWRINDVCLSLLVSLISWIIKYPTPKFKGGNIYLSHSLWRVQPIFHGFQGRVAGQRGDAEVNQFMARKT